jgi:hypothetical protein
MSELSEEVRNQIKNSCDAWNNEFMGNQADQDIQDIWMDGATTQHPIAYRAGWNDAVEAMIGMHRQLIDRAQSRIDQVLTVDNEIDADRAAILRAAITNSGEAIKKLEAMRKV